MAVDCRTFCPLSLRAKGAPQKTLARSAPSPFRERAGVRENMPHPV